MYNWLFASIVSSHRPRLPRIHASGSPNSINLKLLINSDLRIAQLSDIFIRLKSTATNWLLSWSRILLRMEFLKKELGKVSSTTQTSLGGKLNTKGILCV